MDVPTLIHPPVPREGDPAPHPAPPATVAVHPQCDECGTVVAPEQRYCVSCGAHRRNVEDPAARYLSQASAMTRRVTSVTTSGVAPVPARSRGLGLASALVLAAVPVAAGLGVVAGHSSGNGDAALVRALSHQSAADNALAAQLAQQGSAGTAGTAAGAAGGGAAAKRSHHQKAGRGHHGRAKAPTGAVSSGTASLSTSKPSAAQVQSGASAVQKVQKASGKGYVNSQSGLPGTIVVP